MEYKKIFRVLPIVMTMLSLTLVSDVVHASTEIVQNETQENITKKEEVPPATNQMQEKGKNGASTDVTPVYIKFRRVEKPKKVEEKDPIVNEIKNETLPQTGDKEPFVLSSIGAVIVAATSLAGYSVFSKS